MAINSARNGPSAVIYIKATFSCSNYRIARVRGGFTGNETAPAIKGSRPSSGKQTDERGNNRSPRDNSLITVATPRWGPAHPCDRPRSRFAHRGKLFAVAVANTCPALLAAAAAGPVGLSGRRFPHPGSCSLHMCVCVSCSRGGSIPVRTTAARVAVCECECSCLGRAVLG